VTAPEEQGQHDETAEEPGQHEETAEELQARQQRANRATRGALAGVLGLEALVVLLMPRALAQSSGGLGATKTALLIALAVLMVVLAAMLRRRWGVGAGSAVQLLFLATGTWLPVALVASVPLVGVWLYLLNLRSQVAGTPGGARMLIS